MDSDSSNKIEKKKILSTESSGSLMPSEPTDTHLEEIELHDGQPEEQKSNKFLRFIHKDKKTKKKRMAITAFALIILGISFISFGAYKIHENQKGRGSLGILIGTILTFAGIGNIILIFVKNKKSQHSKMNTDYDV
ncbi:hypothetical protein M0813_09322 [Anaeramoeba flamelloides]|uniref:DUF4190 domain-containing protein n=1 Tax=Anaeramoeba flamelloides TaxID=1746091 RepID=A0ABQ8X5H3_9EUKA|nr:hypothetical protein M0813_09322 [Anaeramoeba flamelloides]